MGTTFSSDGKMVNLRQKKNKNSQTETTLFYSGFCRIYLILIIPRLYGEVDLLQVNFA